MKATLRIPAESGYKDIEVDIAEEELAKLAEPQKPNRLTGYERTSQGKNYWLDSFEGAVLCDGDYHTSDANAAYTAANYYTSEEVANNNARADQLVRQLRRFAVEHREHEIDWKDTDQSKWSIGFDHNQNELYTYEKLCRSVFGVTYFDSQEAANSAATAFHDELIWYFTEYKDSL